MSTPPPVGTWQASRDALLRATMALTVDQRIDWLEEMIEIAVGSGALPKRVPDQFAHTSQQPPR